MPRRPVRRWTSRRSRPRRREPSSRRALRSPRPRRSRSPLRRSLRWQARAGRRRPDRKGGRTSGSCPPRTRSAPPRREPGGTARKAVSPHLMLARGPGESKRGQLFGAQHFTHVFCAQSAPTPRALRARRDPRGIPGSPSSETSRRGTPAAARGDHLGSNRAPQRARHVMVPKNTKAWMSFPEIASPWAVNSRAAFGKSMTFAPSPRCTNGLPPVRYCRVVFR
jgi:hypothetical protein